MLSLLPLVERPDRLARLMEMRAARAERDAELQKEKLRELTMRIETLRSEQIALDSQVRPSVFAVHWGLASRRIRGAEQQYLRECLRECFGPITKIIPPF